MCKLSGNWKRIKAIARISDGNNYIKSVLTIHYWENAKCELKNKNIVEKGGRLFECKPITQEISMKGSNKTITVGCKGFVQE
jgi:hypothetical protein